MAAPKTSVGKMVKATEPEFVGTSRVRHTGSTIMTNTVGASTLDVVGQHKTVISICYINTCYVMHQ